MAEHSKIEWTDATWNPITGCSVVSPGCTNCYAMRLAGTRLQHHPSRAGLTKLSKAGPVWTGEVRLNEQWLAQPLSWKRPRMIFVCAHGDLFHENVPFEWIDKVFAVMALCPKHTFQVLTKRAARMRAYFATDDGFGRWGYVEHQARKLAKVPDGITLAHFGGRNLPNVWLGVSAEDQARAEERVHHLLETPAAVRFASLEPLLGPICLTHLHLGFEIIHLDSLSGERWAPSCGRIRRCARLDWAIGGGESGHGARPMHADWARSLRDQCAAAGVPFFFKQWGEWIDADEWHRGLLGQFIVRGQVWQPATPLNYNDAAMLASFRSGTKFEHLSSGHTIFRVGKAAAGRMLDGREWSEMPSPSPSRGEGPGGGDAGGDAA